MSVSENHLGDQLNPHCSTSRPLVPLELAASGLQLKEVTLLIIIFSLLSFSQMLAAPGTQLEGYASYYYISLLLLLYFTTLAPFDCCDHSRTFALYTSDSTPSGFL